MNENIWHRSSGLIFVQPLDFSNCEWMAVLSLGSSNAALLGAAALTFALLTASVRAARIGLHSAAEQGQLEPLKVAINGRWDPYNEVQKKPDINGQNKKGRVALHLAVVRRLDRLVCLTMRAISAK